MDNQRNYVEYVACLESGK